VKRAFFVIAAPLLLGISTGQLDSQDVLARYTRAIATVRTPAAVVFSYTVSQTGSNNIEQHHRIYRSGLEVRDETLSIDGVPLTHKVVRFEQRADRYTVARFAPATSAYEMLFLGAVKDGHHLDYAYEATPLNRGAATWIDRITIDGANFLPRTVHFHTQSESVAGNGEVQFGSFGSYWMPVSAAATAQIDGKPARERIVWTDYRFPLRLPPSTFKAPQPLPIATLPPF
jgi:hypothetical protein